MTFGEKMKKIRIEKGLSQQRLGKKLGIKQQTVAQYEKAIYAPKYETVEKIATALDCKISDLCEYYDAVRVQPDISKILKRYNARKTSTNKKTNDNFSEMQIDSSAYEHSHSYANSAEELDKRQIENGKKRDNNIHKYDASIHAEITPEQIEIDRIQNKLLNDKENITEEEAKFYSNYYTSEQYKNSFKRLKEVAQEGLEIINRLQTAYEMLNEDGQEKVAEHAEMIAKIPEYRKTPPQE